MHSRKDVGSPPGYHVSAAEWYTMNLVNPSTLQLFPRSSCYVNLSAHLVCQCKHAVLQSCSHHNARSAGFSHVATCFSPFSLFGCLRWAVSHLWCNTLLPHRVKLQLHDPIFAKGRLKLRPVSHIVKWLFQNPKNGNYFLKWYEINMLLSSKLANINFRSIL